MSIETIQLVQLLLALGKERGERLFIVGGVVRDLMRGARFDDRDLDVVVEGNAIEFAKTAVLRTGGALKKFPNFFTAKIVAPTNFSTLPDIDFASTRTERYEKPGQLPVVALANITEDLSRRDFSINAMALPLDLFAEVLARAARPAKLQTLILDPLKGAYDLEKKLIRVLHERSFSDDPTRLFRAARYTARIQGAFEPETSALFFRALRQGAVKTLSEFRIATEIRKFFLEKNPRLVFSIAQQSGLLAESGLVASADLPALETHLERLFNLEINPLTSKLPSDTVFQIFLRIIAGLQKSEPDALQKLSSFGLNKRTSLEVIADAAFARSKEEPAGGDLTAASLLQLFSRNVMLSTDAHAATELSKRLNSSVG